jgi:hypothetical protein
MSGQHRHPVEQHADLGRLFPRVQHNSDTKEGTSNGTAKGAIHMQQREQWTSEDGNAYMTLPHMSAYLPDRNSRVPNSSHSIGTNQGMHPEDHPHTTDDPRMKDDRVDRGLTARQPTSSRRYQAPVEDLATVAPGTYHIVIPRRSSMRRPTLPQQQEAVLPRGRLHWLVFVGAGMLIMTISYVLLSAAANWWQVTQDDLHYGRPRTFQIDVVVGHNDSATSPSHFIALNLNRRVMIIEFPGGDPTRARVYLGPTLLGDGEALVPVMLSFRDVNGDGKPDMIVSIQDNRIVFINDNGQFRPLRAGERISN